MSEQMCLILGIVATFGLLVLIAFIMSCIVAVCDNKEKKHETRPGKIFAREMGRVIASQSVSENGWTEEKINEKLINEYISKVGCCDECFASVYCTVNRLRESRVPQDYCVKNIKRYFGDRANLTSSKEHKGGVEE